MKDLRAFWCPQCDKQRLIRPIDHVVSLEEKEFETRDKQKISLLTDVCEACERRNFTKYFEPTKEDIKRTLKAIQENTPVAEGKSLEELL